MMATLVTLSAGLTVAQPTVSAVVNAASYENSLAPGTWAAAFGTQLSPSTAKAAAVPLPYSLAGVSVTVGGVNAPLLFVSPGQVNFLIPFEAPVGAKVPVVVTTGEGGSSTTNLMLGRNAPAIFTRNSQGTADALAFDSSYQPIAKVGVEPIMFYATGLGPTDPLPSSSAAGGAASEPFNRAKDTLQVLIGEVPATVLFAGLAPGLPGIYQVNVLPGANPTSNRLGLLQNGTYSNSVTLPIPVGTNVASVSGSIDGLYPATGLYAESGYLGLAGQVTSGPVTISQMLTLGSLRVTFDILPSAKPFQVIAMTPAGNAVIDVDPIQKTLRSRAIVPTPRAKNGDFSSSGRTVYDLISASPFPGNIVPLSRLDPMAYKAGGLASIPSEPVVNSPNGVWANLLPWPSDGHVAIGSDMEGGTSMFSFGGFLDLGRTPLTTQSAQFVLLVDGMLVATKNVVYPVE